MSVPPCLRQRRALLLGGLAALAAASLRAQLDSAAGEAAIKAAYLLRFASYVEWPVDSRGPPDAPLIIGVLGADAVAAELTQVTRGRKVGERDVAVRRYRAAEAPGSALILFVGRSEQSRLGALQQALQSRSFLLVTEVEGGLEQGSMVNFVVRDNRVRFEIDLVAAENAGLQLSSRLLGVAARVHTGTP